MAASLSPSARSERIREYKDTFPSMGIYVVRNTATGRVWLGKSQNVEGALNRIRFELKMRGHRNTALSNEWQHFGAESFTFEVLDRVKKREEPSFDYDAELQALLALWQAELEPSPTGGVV
jgi:hypothetical protein